MTFELHPNLQKKKFVIDLDLSKILINDTEFPWIFLVPQRPNIRQIHDLTAADQQLFIKEVDHCSKVMEVLFKADQLNVAAIGNMTPQLHVHIICRYKDDPHWPDVCWNKPCEPLAASALAERVDLIQKALKH